MSIIGKIIGKMDVSNLRFKKPSKSEHKPSLLKEVMDNPEKFKLEATIEGEEIVVKISKKEGVLTRTLSFSASQKLQVLL